MKQIELNDVLKIYNKKKKNEKIAVNNLNFSIEKGETVAITGHSGAGKSTILQIIGGVNKPTTGNFYYEGTDVYKMNGKQLAKYRNEHVGFVLQEFGLIEYRNVLDNVMIPLYFNKEIDSTKMKRRCEEMLERVDMLKYEYSEAWSLSGGEKQRVAIARALVTNPNIICADEPTGALDIENRNKVISTLLDLNKEGKTIVIVTHDETVANQCNRIIRMNDGCICKEE